MTLAQLFLFLSVAMIASHLVAFLKPDATSAWLKRFPRNIPVGVVLMLAGTAWFEWNLWHENLSDIAPWKNLMLIGFGAVGVACCFFVQDFLAVRGLTVLMLMAAWWICEHVRWHASPWRNVLTAWAYVWVFLGLWWSMSPWRMRDAIQWVTQESNRFRLAAAGGLAWGLILGALGLAVR